MDKTTTENISNEHNEGQLAQLPYTMVPNVIFDYWMPRLKPATFVILQCLCRKIFGWHETSETLSATFLSELTGLSKPTVISGLKELESVNLVIKTQSKDKFGFLPNEYKLNIKKPIDNRYIDHDLENLKNSRNAVKILGVGSQNSLPGVVKNFNQGVVKNFDNHINKDIKETNKEKGEIPTPQISCATSDNLCCAKSSSNLKKELIEYETFGDHVKLKKGDYAQLCHELGKELTDHYIESINLYVPNKPGKAYTDFKAAIKSWFKKDQINGKVPKLSNLKQISQSKTDPLLEEKNKAWFRNLKEKIKWREKDLHLIWEGDFVKFGNVQTQNFTEPMNYSNPKFQEFITHELKKRGLV